MHTVLFCGVQLHFHWGGVKTNISQVTVKQPDQPGGKWQPPLTNLGHIILFFYDKINHFCMDFIPYQCFLKEGRDVFWRQLVGADGGWTNLWHSGPACGWIQATNEKHFVNLKERFSLNVGKANKYYLKLHVTCGFFHVRPRPIFYTNCSQVNLLKWW